MPWPVPAGLMSRSYPLGGGSWATQVSDESELMWKHMIEKEWTYRSILPALRATIVIVKRLGCRIACANGISGVRDPWQRPAGLVVPSRCKVISRLRVVVDTVGGIHEIVAVHYEDREEMEGRSE